MSFAKISTILLVACVCGISAGIIDTIVDTAANGISLNVVGTNVHVGAVAVPLDALCGRLDSAAEVCHVCNVDCMETHNATAGGQCVPQPDGGSSCICDYSGGAKYVCPSYTANKVLKNAQTDAALDVLLAQALRVRYSTVICGPIDTQGTCNIECQANHAANKGTCLGFDTGKGFCICDYTTPAQA